MKASEVVNEICSLTFDNAFNPYSERCEIYDYSDAPQRRKNLLLNILLKASKVEIDSIWIGRDLGYRGGRRTGLALTDDVHLLSHSERWGLRANKFTKGQAVPERTAAIIWDVLSNISDPIFLWNVFPLHPFEPGNPFSNRAHNSKERIAGEEILSLIIDLIKPRRIVAIGNDAEVVAKRLESSSLHSVKVRHPSYGGQTEFLNQINTLYELGGHTKSGLF